MNYEKIYNDIISKAGSEDRKKIKGGIYYEAHHIIPKCMGGSNDKSNLIILTAKEHYMAHRLLCVIYPDNNKLRFALWAMINGLSSSKKRHTLSCQIYAQLKEDVIKRFSHTKKGRPLSEIHKKNMRKPKTKKNTYSKPPISEETRKKMSDAKKGKTFSAEHRKKISEANLNSIHKKVTDDTKNKISIANTGRTRSDETKQKMSEAKKGKSRAPFSEETKRKMSESKKGRRFIEIV